MARNVTDEVSRMGYKSAMPIPLFPTHRRGDSRIDRCTPYESATKKARPAGELSPQVTERAICTLYEDVMSALYFPTHP